MVPFNVVICIIVAQCVFNLLGIWVLSKETKKKDEVIENLSQELDDRKTLIRIYKHLLEAKEEKR